MRQPSLRRTLLAWLVPSLSIVLVLGSFASFKYADLVASRALDESLIDAAIGLGRRVLLQMQGPAQGTDIPVVVDRFFRPDRFDQIFYTIYGQRGEILASDGALLEPRTDTEARPDAIAYESSIHGIPIRIAEVRVPCADFNCLVLVGETMVKRTQERQRTLLITIVPETILTIVALAFVWVGVERGIEPLTRLSDEIRMRSPADLRPFDSTKVPREAHPIVTELNALFARVNAATDSQKRFTANAAHQLRTPLAVLRTHVELAMMHPASPELKELLQHAHAATMRGSRLTHQLLTLARTEPDVQAPPGEEKIELRGVVEELATVLVHAARERRVDLGFELASAPIVGDAFMLSEALTNVVTNAIQYGNAAGRVTVRSGVAGESAFIEVEDDGPGIPVAERERVLERFYRMAGTPGVGSGLGLAIVQEIVRQHHGRLAISDGESGRGCRVRMEFPLAGG